MAGWHDECPDLPAPHETPAAKLDALKPPGARPAADGFRLELDVRPGQDFGGLGQGDPVRRCGHRQSADRVDGAGAAGLASAELEPASGLLAGVSPLPPEPTAVPPSALWEVPLPPPLAVVDSLESDTLAGFGRPPLRSFLAQPDPLKWIVGGLNALVNVPSAAQVGQALGPLPEIEWTISVVRPQFEQM
jgi:hypothetical protein